MGDPSIRSRRRPGPAGPPGREHPPGALHRPLPRYHPLPHEQGPGAMMEPVRWGGAAALSLIHI
eukprot:14738736-Alexandrium_andersonii.AAC.1